MRQVRIATGNKIGTWSLDRPNNEYWIPRPLAEESNLAVLELAVLCVKCVYKGLS